MFIEKVYKSTYVEVQIDVATSKPIHLPNDDVLRGKKVTGIAALRRNSAGQGKSELNRPLVSDQAMIEGYLTMKCDSQSVLDRISLDYISVSQDDKEVLQTELIGITPTKCFVQFADAGSINVGESVVLMVFYED